MTKYLIDPLAPFHARWRDKIGPIRVLSGPVKGYLMCARPNCRPFVLRVSEILNADKPPNGMGPFEPIGPICLLPLLNKERCDALDV